MASEFRVTHGAISQWEAGHKAVPGPVLRLIEIYEDNLGMVAPATEATTGRTWASRTLQTSIAGGKIALRLASTSLASLVASNERAAQLKSATDKRIGADLAQTLGDMKGLAAKLGQMLSTLGFALPGELREQLAGLHDRVPPMPSETARAIVAKELGVLPERLFRRWEDQPFAAASLGQVHRATLWGGEDVAVKVQYPAVTKMLTADLKNAALLDRFATLLFRYQERGSAVEELRERFLEECNYGTEARNTTEFAKLLAPWHEIVVPRVYPRFSTSRILTTEMLIGRTFAEFTKGADQQEKNRVGELLFEATFTLIFRHHIFNCDPSPGNFLFLSDGRVAFLDFGCVKRFPPRLISVWKRLTVATLKNEQSTLRRELIRHGFIERPDVVDIDQFLAFIRTLCEPWLVDATYRFSPSYTERTWRELLDSPERFKLTMPKDMLFTTRLQWGLCALLADLGAEANWHRIMRRILKI